MTYEPGSTFKNVATFTIYIIKNVEKWVKNITKKTEYGIIKM
jgi:hypothetical protein